MENNVLDLSRNFIENQKRQIEIAKQLIECANGDEEVIGMANKMTECGYPTHPYDPFFKK